MNWIALAAQDQLEAINLQSFSPEIKGILLFKHSTRCSISQLAIDRLERSFNYSPEKLPAYFLDLLNYKSLSDYISEKYAVPHQSPQILIIKNGKCIYTASHMDISFIDIQSAIDQ